MAALAALIDPFFRPLRRVFKWAWRLVLGNCYLPPRLRRLVHRVV
jgi:hypothetical protein